MSKALDKNVAKTLDKITARLRKNTQPDLKTYIGQVSRVVSNAFEDEQLDDMNIPIEDGTVLFEVGHDIINDFKLRIKRVGMFVGTDNPHNPKVKKFIKKTRQQMKQVDPDKVYCFKVPDLEKFRPATKQDFLNYVKEIKSCLKTGGYDWTAYTTVIEQYQGRKQSNNLLQNLQLLRQTPQYKTKKWDFLHYLSEYENLTNHDLNEEHACKVCRVSHFDYHCVIAGSPLASVQTYDKLIHYIKHVVKRIKKQKQDK